MSRINLKLLALAASSLGLGACAFGQVYIITDPDWDLYCIPADATTPYSDDYNTFPLVNDLFGVTVGIAGTVNYGACVSNYTQNIQGRIGFTIGTKGSVQDELDDQGNANGSSGIDNNMRLTFGMPTSPGGCAGYAMITQGTDGGTRSMFGTSGFSTYFVGASNRYMFMETTNEGCTVQLRVDLAADGARLAYTLQSSDANTQKRGLWFGQWVTMLYGDYLTSAANFVTTPGRRPLITDQMFDRTTDPTGFPQTMKFTMTQDQPYGLQILNGPNSMTYDATGINSDATQADALLVGKNYLLLNGPYSTSNTMPGTLIPDTYFIDTATHLTDYTAFIQKFPLKDVPANTTPIDSISPQFVTYYKSATGNSNYALPYSATVDAPHLIQVSATDPTTFLPNPGVIRVYLDNTGGFGGVYKEIALEGVKVTLSLPLGLYDAETSTATNPTRLITKIIDKVAAKTIGYVDFKVGVAPDTVGDVTYTVKIDPGSTIASKTISGAITVASQPRLYIYGTDAGLQGANLIAPCWVFSNNDWSTILTGTDTTNPFVLDDNFRALAWDGQLQSYIPSTGAQRGEAVWILSKISKSGSNSVLGGSPTIPTDLTTGAPTIKLHSGWNLIGNPYNYSFPLAQVNGVSGAVQTAASTFQSLVDQGIVSGSLSYWDPVNQKYSYIDVNGDVAPNKGYWVYVATTEDLTLSFPPIYQEYLRSATPSTSWVQSDKHWRLQLAARTDKAIDDQNFVGYVSTASQVASSRAVKPPVAPIDGAVSVSVKDTVNSRSLDMASTYTSKSGKQEWNVNVYAKQAGNVTVTWPNIATLPKNLKVRLVDVATGASRDMRRSSGYTFSNTDTNSTRAFKVQIETGTVSSAKIGSVVISGGRGTGSNSALSVNYTLTSAATTTVRILGADGREVYVPTSGRADSAGQNSVTWNLRDSANRAVPPGVYRVEIVAESTDGERVRKITPVVVTR